MSLLKSTSTDMPVLFWGTSQGYPQNQFLSLTRHGSMTEGSARDQCLEWRRPCVKYQTTTSCGIWCLDTLSVYTVGCLQAFLKAVWRLSVKPLCFHKANRFGNVLPFPQVLRLCRQEFSSWTHVKYMDSKSMSLVFLVHIYFTSHFSYLSNKNYSYSELGRVSRS